MNSNIAGGAYALTVLTPIEPGRESALRALLQGLDHAGSPLNEFPGTHFGRWVVLENFVTAAGQSKAEHLSCQYLLFTSCFDGALEPYLAAVSRQPVAQTIWDHCIGWSKTKPSEALVDYLRHNQIDTGLFVAAYPDAGLAKVRRSLLLRERMMQFAVRAQGMNAQERQQAFMVEFGVQ